MCLKPRQIVDSLNRDIKYETYTEELDCCDYIDYGDAIPVDPNKLVIVQLNVRGLYSKLDQIKSLLNVITLDKAPDVLMLCETWQSRNSPVPNLPGYQYVYKARMHKLGGVVGIFISDRIKHKSRPDLEVKTETFEHCIVELKLKNKKMLMCSGYRAPGENPGKFVQEYENVLSHMNSTGLPVIIGLDHNLDLLKHKKHNPASQFVEKNLDLNMVPCITKPTRITKSSATLIDNIFVPLNIVPNVSSNIVIEDMSDHLPIVMKLRNVQLAKMKQKVFESRDLRPKNLRNLKESIDNYDWHGFLSNVILRNGQTKSVIPQNVNVSEKFSAFHKKLLDMIDMHVPLQMQHVNSKKFRREPWLTNGFCNSMSKCKQLYKASIIKNASDNAITHYKNYRNCLNKSKRQAKLSYYQSLCIKLKNNTKKLWEIINNIISKSSNKTCILEKLKVDIIVYDTLADIANNLGSYFATVGTKFTNAIKPSTKKVSVYTSKIKRNPKSLFLTPTTSTEICNLIENLPNKSSSGFDQINNKLLKAIKVEISKPLEIIFNNSLTSGIFPEVMKMAEVIPLYKGKCKLEPRNY